MISMGESEDRKIVPDVITTIAKGAGAIVVGGVGLGSAWLAYSALFVNHNMPLPDAIGAERHRFPSSSGGWVSWYGEDAGGGRPLVLVHGIGVTASAYEMRPLFERFRGERPVCAIDLPGFGFSERTDRVYFPELYAETLIEWIESYLPGSAQPVDLIASSLSCEFAAIAAAARPELFHSLTFVSPTGFEAAERRGPSEQALRLSSVSFWSQGYYDLLTTRASIRHALRKRFVRGPDEGLVHYSFQTAHQPGARFAPLHYLSGHLFIERIREFYAALDRPVLAIANEDDNISHDLLPEFVAHRPNWRMEIVPEAKSLPHFENITDTLRTMGDFWRNLPACTTVT